MPNRDAPGGYVPGARPKGWTSSYDSPAQKEVERQAFVDNPRMPANLRAAAAGVPQTQVVRPATVGARAIESMNDYTLPNTAVPSAPVDYATAKDVKITPQRTGDFNNLESVKAQLAKYLGSYDKLKNDVPRLPEQDKTERLARLTDLINNQYHYDPGTQMNVLGANGQQYSLGGRTEAGHKQAPRRENEDARMQEKMRDLEAKRLEWSAGLPQTAQIFGKEADTLANAKAAMNNLVMQYESLDIRQALMNAGVDVESAKQMASEVNRLVADIKRWNSRLAQMQAKFGSNLPIKALLEEAQSIFANAENFPVLHYLVTRQGGGIPGMGDRWAYNIFGGGAGLDSNSVRW
jgi:hypothetical protein